MNLNKLDKMIKGWVVGNFNPSVYKTDNFEVAIKKYDTGDYEQRHFHKVATEITVISKGKVNREAPELSERKRERLPLDKNNIDVRANWMGQNKTFNWHAAARMALEQYAWKNKRFFIYFLGMVKSRCLAVQKTLENE